MAHERSTGDLAAEICAGLGGRAAFAARRLGARQAGATDDERVLVRADEAFPAGDLARLPIAVEALRRIDLGQFRFDDPVEGADELLAGGGMAPDALAPGAANALLDLVGLGEVNETMSRLKLERTRLARLFGDVDTRDPRRKNTTSADDMVTLVGLIAGRALPGSQRLLAMLSAPRAADALMTGGLPSDAQLAHCGGAQDDLVHDAGVLTGPGGACAYCLLMAAQPDARAAYGAVGETLRLLWGEWRLGAPR
jgi:beta-lactamase class A